MKRLGYVERNGDSAVFRLYTPDEAAQVLRCKASWLKEQARLRRIPFTLVSGSYRFTLDHLAQIVEANEHHPTNGPLPVQRRRRPDESPAEIAQLQARRPRQRLQSS